MITLYRRTNTWWRTHPAESAGTSFVLTAGLVGTALRASGEHDIVVMVVAYLFAFVAAVFGALEAGRVSAGGTR